MSLEAPDLPSSPWGRYGPPPVHAVILVPHPDVWRRAGAPGGLSLLERQLKQLRALGHEPPVLLVPNGDPLPMVPPGLGVSAVIEVPATARSAPAALHSAAPRLPADFLFLSADRVVDRRVIEALAAGDGPRLVANENGTVEPVGRLGAAAILADGDALADRAARLPLTALDPYSRELRGVATPYVLTVRTDDERRAAWRILLDHVQKRCLDLPGEYFDSPFENALVRWLAPTRVTPNQITLATTLLAGVVAMMFLQGWLRVGVLLALVVGVLDGVDGKLARLKLATSRLGELEHIADFFYESSWYLALGAFLQAASGLPIYWFAGLTMVGVEVADGLLYMAVRARTGHMLDELSRFDRGFRRIAGRRNVYVWILVPGVVSLHPGPAFLAAAAWAVVTVAVHAARALVWLGSRERPAQVSESDPSIGALVSER